MAVAAGIKTVCVVTDSDAALRPLPKDSGLDFIYDDEERRYDNGIARMLTKEPSMKKQETMTAIRNMYLLVNCDYVIACNSALAECALALSYYRNKQLNAIMLQQPGPSKEAARLNGVKLENPADCKAGEQSNPSLSKGSHRAHCKQRRSQQRRKSKRHYRMLNRKTLLNNRYADLVRHPDTLCCRVWKPSNAIRRYTECNRPYFIGVSVAFISFAGVKTCLHLPGQPN